VEETGSNFEKDATVRDDRRKEGLHALLEVEMELEEIGLHVFEGCSSGRLARRGGGRH
jgi:hypothetical protein